MINNLVDSIKSGRTKSWEILVMIQLINNQNKNDEEIIQIINEFVDTDKRIN